MNAVNLPVPPPAPPGTIPPGTTIQIGRFTVVINHYIAEGGFAHVYLATLADGSGYKVVVKRIAVPDKERLAIVSKEIETMKSLGKHKNIVEYFDSCMGKLEGGGYEVLILIEYCGSGPVIDLMNRRLQHRLTEPEILKIFSNVCEAVAYLHYCDPPILHRDIKVENILLSVNDYKLCDFGSATTNILRGDSIPRNVKDIQLLEEEINNYTTLQYRAPEMLDLYMRRGIDEKIDIWALGVLLYKLCYYTTPFEEQGQLAILNARYTIPDYPAFSPGLINIFKSILKEDPRHRPNIYQVMKATSALRGLPCPIQNKYPDTSFTPPPSDAQQSATANILTSSTVARPMDVLPSIEPMRRGRPTRPQAATTAAPVAHQNGTQETFQTPPPQNGFSHGFDDSFGQFSSATDPAPQFSKFSSAGDAFDFESTGPSKSETKRFTLDLGTVNDDFGFKFSNVESKDSSPAASSTSATAPAVTPRPRPPSLGSSDFVPSESFSSNLRTNAMSPSPAQFSGATLSTKKPTADELFFGPASSSNTGSQSPGMVKPLLPSQQVSQASGQPSLPVRPSAIKGLPTTTSVAMPDVNSRGPRSTNTNNTGMTLNSNPQKQEVPSGPKSSLELLQRQQMEQLGMFSLDSTSAPNAQGKPMALDPSKTLDGMKSHDMSLRMGTGSGPTTGLGPTPPPLAPRPQVTPLANLVVQPKAPSLDKKELARKDMESELRLLELQQKDFEKQRQELLAAQRRELEEQQQQHRAQQELLQKQQHHQIQLQHEKWLERNRVMSEKEQLTEQQFQQQRELRKRHDAQQQLQQQQQQQQRLPDISNVAASMASVSLTTTDPNILAATGQQRKAPLMAAAGTGQQATAIYPSVVLIGSRPSPTTPTSATNGTGASATSTATSPSPVVSSSSSSTTATTKARRISVSNLPPGQKPQLMPKPTRFRMKDGTGTLAAGEEEAFMKRFPSADLDDDLIQLEQQPTSPFAPSPSTSQGSDRTQYMSPSQRARELESGHHGGGGVQAGRGQDDEEEEEEETLIRRRRPPYTNPSAYGQSTRPIVAADTAEPVTPAESVRDRVLRMNRIGGAA